MKLRNALIAPIALLATLPFAAQADTLGLTVGGGTWEHDPGGTIRYQSTLISDDVDLDNDLHLKTEKESYYYITLEHPVPVLPNIRVMTTNLGSTGSGAISKSVTFGGVTYTASETVTTELKLDQTDFTLYYELLDNVVSLDLGLNVKNIDGKASIVGAVSGSASDTFDVFIPMLYAKVGFSPIEGLFIGAEGSGVSYDGNSLTDFTAKISYTSEFLLGVEAGVRQQKYTLDNVDDTWAEMDFSGPFLGLYLHF